MTTVNPIPRKFGAPLRHRACGLILLLGFLLPIASQANTPQLKLSLSQLNVAELQFQEAVSWIPTDTLSAGVSLIHAAGTDDAIPSDPVPISPLGKAWPQTVSIKVTGPDGKEVTLPWERSGTLNQEPFLLRLESEQLMSFFLPSDPTRKLAPGRYSFVAVIEITDGPGWRGRIESEAADLEVTAPPVAKPTLVATVVGADALAPGDPWVISIELHPANGAEASWRQGYTFSVQNVSGTPLPWTFEPAALPSPLPADLDLEGVGLGPVLSELSPASQALVTPGQYRINVRWSAAAGSPEASGNIDLTVQPKATVEAHPARREALASQRFALATALLLRADFSSTADIQKLVARAAPTLIDLERTTIEGYLAATDSSQAAAALAETLLLQGNFAGAQTFATLALNLWTPPSPSPDQPSAVSEPLPRELTELLQTIQTRSNQVSRVLPYLRPALVATRGWDPDDPNSSVPGESAWASFAQARSQYGSTGWSSAQATGAPDVSKHSDSRFAWASAKADAGEEWLELTYAQPTIASGIEVVQSFNPGAIQRLEVIDGAGLATTVWTGPDTNTYPSGQIGTLKVSFPATAQMISRVKVTLDTRRIAGWNEIDAVKLLSARPLDPPKVAFVVQPADATVWFASWRPGFVLQRASSLAPSDWATVATSPPVSIEMGSQAAFFRLAPQP